MSLTSGAQPVVFTALPMRASANREVTASLDRFRTWLALSSSSAIEPRVLFLGAGSGTAVTTGLGAALCGCATSLPLDVSIQISLAPEVCRRVSISPSLTRKRVFHRECVNQGPSIE